MAESERKDSSESTGIPAWQRESSTTEPSPTTGTRSPPRATIEQAKRFLQDIDVKNTSREKKFDFLKSKGLEDSEIEVLLDEDAKEQSAQVVSQAEGEEVASEERRVAQSPESSDEHEREDRPPIVTYPEFLASRQRPPPLMTVSGFFNTLYAFGGLSALLYGTSEYVLAPMVESLTNARVSLHGTAAENLTKLIDKLESTVSEIPATKTIDPPSAHTGQEDSHSSYDDPTELFHRDVGVQTSLPPSPAEPNQPQQPTESASAQQARRVSDLAASLQAVADGVLSQGEDLVDAQAALGAFRNDLHQLAYQRLTNDYGSNGVWRYGQTEPDDEIRRTKENIRRVKGVLLSVRSFPGVPAR